VENTRTETQRAPVRPDFFRAEIVEPAELIEHATEIGHAKGPADEATEPIASIITG
jgi:hypothetical protein